MEELLYGNPTSNLVVYLIVGIIIGLVVAVAVAGILDHIFLDRDFGELPKSNLKGDDIM